MLPDICCVFDSSRGRGPGEAQLWECVTWPSSTSWSSIAVFLVLISSCLASGSFVSQYMTLWVASMMACCASGVLETIIFFCATGLCFYSIQFRGFYLHPTITAITQLIVITLLLKLPKGVEDFARNSCAWAAIIKMHAAVCPPVRLPQS